MKTQWIASIAISLAAVGAYALGQDEKPSGKPQGQQPLKTVKEKVSYGIGTSIGKNLKGDGLDVDLDLLMKGIKDALAGSKPLVSDAELREAMAAFQKEMRAKQEDRAKVQGDKNKKEGVAFLAENKKKDGVKTTASGLQYKIIKEGSGKKPKATDTVTTHYRGALIDGTVFDSSYDRGEPASFAVNKVIKGWTEALQMMSAGSKWQLVIPGELAYGEGGAGSDIGPNAVLIFEVELISIK